MMHTVDPHPQPFNGQRREQRHPEDGSTNNFIPPSGFLLPSDVQGQFTYSAEPSSMLDYGSMSNTNPREAVFTPNNGSSHDSSLHPDAINPSYSSAGTYMQVQNYNLSPGTHSRNGQSLSPSHSVDHLSPEAGYLSDPSYHDISNYTTPSFNGHYLDESFSQLNFTENVSPNGFPQYQGEADMSLLTNGTLATYNAQPPMLPNNAQLDAQLLSPCPTNNSSPVVTDDNSRNASLVSLQHIGNEYHPSSTPPGRAPQLQHATPSKQQQHSPALTNSPNNIALANPQPRASHLTSPIVRVENYSGRDSPTPSDASRPVSKRSHGSRRSGNHLSPVPDLESSDGDDDADMRQRVRVQHVVRNAKRNEDGSWLVSPASGQAGLSPDERQAMGDAWVPSIEEVVEQRLKEDKKLEVQDWLSRSEVGTRPGEGGTSTGLLKPFATRRRAKSTNDVHRQGRGPAFGLGVRTDFDRLDDSRIPGPGVYINEPSEFDDYEDEEDEDEEPQLAPESPPAEIEIGASQVDKEVSYFPPLENGGISGVIVRPWVDVPSQPSTTSTQYQPPTSNAAMMRFRIRAKEVDRASLAATVGSRRLSESDIGSIRAAPGVIKVTEPAAQKHKERQRRPSFLENILPKRTPSNLLKRKQSMPVQQPADSAVEKVREPSLDKPKRMGSWGRPKSPRLDTSVGNQGKDVGPLSSTGLSATSGTWYQGAKKAIRRSRSKSDLGKSPGLAQLMTQHGGPPMPMLASPLPDAETNKLSPQPSPGGDEDDDDMQEAVTMDLAVRSDPIIPTHEGFKTHARQLNPRLTDYMVERITQEQMRRYKRLLEFKVKHLNVIKSRSCSSGKFCPDLGGESKQLAPRAGKQDADAPFIGFQVTAPGSSDDDGDALPEGSVAAANFPPGVPSPPVKRLPAEFECPLCFKVKKFYKPSDWTKHVHEDVQPFTCTFPNCGEPKSFKRKADWVRHENERHRQLEHWTCQIADCNHTCYRKDNFVQHLVREHKIAEPRQRTVKGVAKDPPAGAETDDIWSLVARCRGDTTKQPKDEPCRFCGNICTTWKKLTVHLAKHMEQISMPILPLVEQKQMNADTIISPVVEMPENRKLSATPNRSPVENPSRYNPTSTLAPGIDPSFGQYPSAASGAVASNVMHTYPPPHMVPYKTEGQVQSSNYANLAAENPQGYGGRTYPGLHDPAKARGAYVNNLQIPNQQYLNGNMQSGANRVPMTPASSIGQSSIFTDSPIDSGSYSNDTLGSTYFTQEPPNVPANGLPNMGFDAGNTMPFQQTSPYQEMAYMTPQQNYHYQGQ